MLTLSPALRVLRVVLAIVSAMTSMTWPSLVMISACRPSTDTLALGSFCVWTKRVSRVSLLLCDLRDLVKIVDNPCKHRNLHVPLTQTDRGNVPKHFIKRWGRQRYSSSQNGCNHRERYPTICLVVDVEMSDLTQTLPKQF